MGATARRGRGGSPPPADRFDYLYREEELDEWAPRVRTLGEKAEEVHVVMNNCFEDKAIINARQLKQKLSAR